MRVSEYFSGFSRNLLAKSEFNGYSIYHEIKTQLREECSSDVGFWVRNFHQHSCARRSPGGTSGLITTSRLAASSWIECRTSDGISRFNLQIDGRPVANVAQGHSYSTWLPAGPHVLTVTKVPAVGYTDPTSTTVNIQPGAEHLYTAMWDSGLVYLQPGGVSLTPGAYWQNHGDGAP